MSKEYKLLKKYPSLPTDWEVGMKVGLGDRNYGYSPCAGNYSDCRKLGNPEVENNSEFWGEVVEDEVLKDYEVLSFKKQGDIFKVRKNGRLLLDIPLYEVLNAQERATHWTEALEKGYTINSVKLLSDNTTFTVKDKYKNMSGEFTIKGFTIHGDMCFIEAEEYGSCCLSAVEKVKEPLFISFDGEKMFEGDICYIPQRRGEDDWYSLPAEFKVTKNSSKWKNIIIFADKNKAEEYIKTFKNYKTVDGKQIKEGDVFYCYDNKFHKCLYGSFGQFKSSKWDEKRYRTEEEVKELILMNKPCLSLNELLSVWSTNGLYEVYKESLMFQNFKKFAENKIKNEISK